VLGDPVGNRAARCLRRLKLVP